MARAKKLLSQSEYARQRGISQPYVHKLIRRGLIPTHPGGIDPRKADRSPASETQSSAAGNRYGRGVSRWPRQGIRCARGVASPLASRLRRHSCHPILRSTALTYAVASVLLKLSCAIWLH